MSAEPRDSNVTVALSGTEETRFRRLHSVPRTRRVSANGRNTILDQAKCRQASGERDAVYLARMELLLCFGELEKMEGSLCAASILSSTTNLTAVLLNTSAMQSLELQNNSGESESLLYQYLDTRQIFPAGRS